MNNINGAKSILCLGGGVESVEILKQINALGYRVIVVDQDQDCPAVKWSKTLPKHPYLPDNDRSPFGFINADCYRSNSIIHRVGAVKNAGFYMGDVAAVMCCAIDAPLVCAEVAQYLKLPYLDIEAAQLGVNKFYQWERLYLHGIPVPKTIVVSPETNLDEIVDFDIVKPVDSRGARGVLAFNSLSFKQHCVEALSHSNLKQVIAQQWIDGRQLSTESVICNGEALFTAVAERNYSRLTQFYPYIIEDGSDSPAELSSYEFSQVVRVIEQSCIALKWINLTVKGDLILDENGVVYVVELAPRLSGGYFASHIIPLSSGWNIVHDAVLLAQGLDPVIEVKRGGKFVCQKFVFPKPEWIGKKIKSLPKIDGPFHTWNFKSGDIVREVKSHPDRLGQVIADCDNLLEAQAWAENVIQSMLDGIEVA